MNEKEVRKLKTGIYRLYWKSGGSSLASVGCMSNGDKWLCPVNWTNDSCTPDIKYWNGVKRAVLIDITKRVGDIFYINQGQGKPYKCHILAIFDNYMVAYKYYGRHKQWWHYEIKSKITLGLD